MHLLTKTLPNSQGTRSNACKMGEALIGHRQSPVWVGAIALAFACISVVQLAELSAVDTLTRVEYISATPSPPESTAPYNVWQALEGETHYLSLESSIEQRVRELMDFIVGANHYFVSVSVSPSMGSAQASSRGDASQKATLVLSVSALIDDGVLSEHLGKKNVIETELRQTLLGQLQAIAASRCLQLQASIEMTALHRTHFVWSAWTIRPFALMHRYGWLLLLAFLLKGALFIGALLIARRPLR